MESEELFRLGSNDQPWTQEQIDEFMDRLEAEMFEGDRYRGRSGFITSLTREDANGNESTYVKEDGVWNEVN